MKDLVTDLQLNLAHDYYATYRLDIENVNKLNLRRHQCQTSANEFEAKSHSQGKNIKCRADCVDELYSRSRCDCTELNAFNSNPRLPDCQHIFFNEYIKLNHIR